MRQKNKKKKDFRELLEKYLQIKGLDIVVVLENGKEVELFKHRELIEDVIISLDKIYGRIEIPLKTVKSVDLYAA